MKCLIRYNLYYNHTLIGYRAVLEEGTVVSDVFDCVPYHLDVLQAVGVVTDFKNSVDTDTTIINDSLVPIGQKEAPLLNVGVILEQLNIPEAYMYNEEAHELYYTLKELNLSQFGLNKHFLIAVSKTNVEPVLYEAKKTYDVLTVSKRYLAREELAVEVLSLIAYDVIKTPEIVDYFTSLGYTLKQPRIKRQKPTFDYFCMSCSKEYKKDREIHNLNNHRCSCGGLITKEKINKEVI